MPPKKKTRRPARKAARKSVRRPARRPARKAVRKAAAPARGRKHGVKKSAFTRTLRLAGAMTGAQKTLSPKDIDALWEQLQTEERSEKAWQEMTGQKPYEDEDRWNQVEEDLVQEANSRNGDIKRWKYFAK
ncbi:MAG: hypothetical protein WC969_08960 [Elusimicrobiota bacterium]|jgi:hypothetical protein